jgi:hypothetical protein
MRSQVASGLALARHCLLHPREGPAHSRAALEVLHHRLARHARGASRVTAREADIHGVLGVDWPCGGWHEFVQAWRDIKTRLADAGIGWDADPALARAAFCLVRHLRPDVVVETGVARGVTSAVVLDAMGRNGAGHLWSVDLPPFDPKLRAQVGRAVPKRRRARWSYVHGSSRRALPPLIDRLPAIDAFIHDSVHTRATVLFELELVWGALRDGGVVLVDDVDVHDGFSEFVRRRSPRASLVLPGTSAGTAFGLLVKGKRAAAR